MASYERRLEQLAIRLAGPFFVFVHSQRRPEPGFSARQESSNARSNLLANIDNETRTIGTVHFQTYCWFETVAMYIRKIRRELRFRCETA